MVTALLVVFAGSLAGSLAASVVFASIAQARARRNLRAYKLLVEMGEKALSGSPEESPGEKARRLEEKAWTEYAQTPRGTERRP